MRKILILAISTVLFMATGIIVSADAVPNYSSSKTLNYAAAHWNDTTEPNSNRLDCAEFARTCVQKGGVPADSARVFSKNTGYTPEEYMNYLVYNGYAVLNKLTVSGAYYYVDSEINSGLVAPGDIIAYKCTNPSCEKQWFHLSICGDDGFKGSYYSYYAHNSNVGGDKALCAIKHSKCGTPADQVELYAVHMTSKANGFTSSYSGKVTGVKATREAYNKLKISWNPVEGASKYYVYCRTTKSGLWKPCAETTEASAIYTVPSKNYGTGIYFWVRPCKVINDKEYVGAKSSVVTNYTVAAKPANVKARLTAYNGVKVSWSNGGGASGYKVEYKTSTASKWTVLKKATTSVSATKTKLTAGKKYYFRITPYTKGAGYSDPKYSPNKAQVTIYTLKKLSAPTVKRVNKSTVKVGWNNISGETGYQISKAAKKSGTKIVATVETTTGKNTTINTPKNKKFYYKVRAYKVEDGKKIYGPWSSVKYFTK